MKGKSIFLKGFITALLTVCFIWQATGFAFNANFKMMELLKQLLLSTALVWMVTVLFKQNQDDDDWAGQL